MATFSAPVTHTAVESTLGYTAVFAEARLDAALAEKIDPEALGLVTAVGDLAGTGSDTLTITYIDSVGYAEAFTAMAAETTAITASGFDATNDTVTIARYGLGKSETYQRRILSRSPETVLDSLVAQVPDSLRRTIMGLLATQIASISAGVGTSGAAWSFDAELDMLAHFRGTEGFEGPAAFSVRHPEQYTDLFESLRDEPAYQVPAVLDKLITLGNSGSVSESMWGVMNIASSRITTSGGDHIGGAYAAGAFALARASTAALASENPGASIIVPRMGLYIIRATDGNAATGSWNANAWIGIAQRATAVAPAVRLVSVND